MAPQPPLQDPWWHTSHQDKFQIDLTAQHFYPQDAPEHLIPCKCHGDGNCFMRTLSNLLFGTEDYHLALRAAAVFEAIIHRSYYLDNIYLQYGGTDDNNLRSQFAVYSGVYNDVVTTHWNDNTTSMKLRC